MTRPLDPTGDIAVSVVIPTRGRPTLVLRAISSALNQTYAGVEVIVVLDGPDLPTQDALKDITDCRLHVITLEASVGGAEARNVGVRNSRGKWVAFLDDDDEWLPSKIEKQIESGASAESEVLVVSKYLLRQDGEDLRVLPRRLPAHGEHFSEYLMCSRGPAAPEAGFQTSVLFVPRTLIERVPFQKGLPRHQDWDWLLRVVIGERIKILIVPEVLSILHVDTARDSVSKSLNWQNSLCWAKSNRHLFTNRAYSSFIARECAPRAARSPSSWKSIPTLLKECVWAGSPSLLIVLIFVRSYLAPIKALRLIKRAIRQPFARRHVLAGDQQ